MPFPPSALTALPLTTGIRTMRRPMNWRQPTAGQAWTCGLVTIPLIPVASSWLGRVQQASSRWWHTMSARTVLQRWWTVSRQRRMPWRLTTARRSSPSSSRTRSPVPLPSRSFPLIRLTRWRSRSLPTARSPSTTAQATSRREPRLLMVLHWR